MGDQEELNIKPNGEVGGVCFPSVFLIPHWTHSVGLRAHFHTIIYLPLPAGARRGAVQKDLRWRALVQD